MRTLMTEARRRLLRRKQFLEDKLEGQFRPRVTGYRLAPRASEALEEARVSGFLNYREQQELLEIEVALEHMAAGTYGHCAECGGSIGRLRLLAVPEAQCCLACASGAPLLAAQ